MLSLCINSCKSRSIQVAFVHSNFNTNNSLQCTFYTRDNELKEVTLQLNETIKFDMTIWICCKRLETR